MNKSRRERDVLITGEEFKVGLRLLVSFGKLMAGQCSAPNLIAKWAKLHPDRPAIYFGDRIVSYRQLYEEMNRVANHFLALGANTGDTVAVFMENCPEYLALLAGLNRAGLIGSLINTHLRHKVLTHAFTICSPRWIVASASLLPAVEEILADVPVGRPHLWVWDGEAPEAYQERDLARVLPAVSSAAPDKPHRPKFDDHILNIYTSGTTGLPKAARVSNRRVFFSGYALGYCMSRYNYEDCIYAPLPLYHSMGIFVSWGSALATGAALATRRRFSASEFWPEAKKLNATAAIFIGEMPRYLLSLPPGPQDRDHRVRKVITVGLRANVWEEFRRRYGIEKVFEFYGATETNVGIMNLEGRPGFLGRYMPLQAAVVKWDPETETLLRDDKGRCIWCQPGEEGMLIGRKSRILNLLGYDGYLDEEANQQKAIKGAFSKWDEWFVTGDVVKLHEDRWVSFQDRAGDTYRWKSENVATKEVEMVLDECPLVAEVTVYGVKVPGQEGAAGMAALVCEGEWEEEVMSRHVAEKLPHYARPLFIRLCRELPKTSTMKLIKYTLRNDGFDPAKVQDPIFFWDRGLNRYVRLDEDLYADICAGNIKL
jgi:acyl-CoA synthetase (AMP-forming)/AMP-acid ligase II